MIVESAFKPAWWLTNTHAQTVYSTLTRRVKAPIDKRERLELPDGDFIDLAWANNGLPADSPLVVFLHGLGGGVSSTYVAGQLRAYNRAGWRGVLMHFRGASLEANRLPRAYHSGDTHDWGRQKTKRWCKRRWRFPCRINCAWWPTESIKAFRAFIKNICCNVFAKCFGVN